MAPAKKLYGGFDVPPATAEWNNDAAIDRIFQETSTKMVRKKILCQLDFKTKLSLRVVRKSCKLAVEQTYSFQYTPKVVTQETLKTNVLKNVSFKAPSLKIKRFIVFDQAKEDENTCQRSPLYNWDFESFQSLANLVINETKLEVVECVGPVASTPMSLFGMKIYPQLEQLLRYIPKLSALKFSVPEEHLCTNFKSQILQTGELNDLAAHTVSVETVDFTGCCCVAGEWMKMIRDVVIFNVSVNSEALLTSASKVEARNIYASWSSLLLNNRSSLVEIREFSPDHYTVTESIISILSLQKVNFPLLQTLWVVITDINEGMKQFLYNHKTQFKDLSITIGAKSSPIDALTKMENWKLENLECFTLKSIEGETEDIQTVSTLPCPFINAENLEEVYINLVGSFSEIPDLLSVLPSLPPSLKHLSLEPTVGNLDANMFLDNSGQTRFPLLTSLVLRHTPKPSCLQEASIRQNLPSVKFVEF